jgi:hypothetical protein
VFGPTPLHPLAEAVLFVLVGALGVILGRPFDVAWGVLYAWAVRGRPVTRALVGVLLPVLVLGVRAWQGAGPGEMLLFLVACGCMAAAGAALASRTRDGVTSTEVEADERTSRRPKNLVRLGQAVRPRPEAGEAIQPAADGFSE